MLTSQESSSSIRTDRTRRRAADGGATARAIKELILREGLRPGDPFPTEAELVDVLEVSRSSVREAVRRLVALDILEVRHGTGTFVGQLSLRPLVEGMVFRGALLPGENNSALRNVVELRRSLDLALEDEIVSALHDADVSELRTEVDAMVERAATGHSLTEHDRRFHLMLAERVDNELYAQLVAAFWDIHQTVAPSLGVASTDDLQASAQAHVDILQSACCGDVTGYRAAVTAHYVPILRALGSASR